METLSENQIKWAKRIGVAIVSIIVVMILNPFVQVQAGTKGLVFNWGAIQDKTLDQGLHLRVPFMQKVEHVSVQTQQLDYDVPVGAAGAITKDNQTIGASLTLFYRYDEARLVEMRRDWGAQKLLAQVQTNLNESFKEVIGEYTIFDVATKQEEIRGKVWERLTSKATAYPLSPAELRIQNYDWSDAFDAQINATMERAQQVKQAEQDLLLTEQQAQKQVKQAEAAKAALIAQAEGEKAAAALRAEAKVLEGEGNRKYNESMAKNLDVEIRIRELEIELEKARHFNGAIVPNMTVVVPGYGTIPQK